MSEKWKVYLASGWFSPAQDEQLTRLEALLDKRADWIELFSPRREFVCPPDASLEVQEKTFQGNVNAIKNASICICNTSFRDIGTIFEAGSAHAQGTPIVYFCEGLPEGAKFNLMLSRSGQKVCTSTQQLEDYLDRCHQADVLLYEPYDKEIE